MQGNQNADAEKRVLDDFFHVVFFELFCDLAAKGQTREAREELDPDQLTLASLVSNCKTLVLVGEGKSIALGLTLLVVQGGDVCLPVDDCQESLAVHLWLLAYLVLLVDLVFEGQVVVPP